jgi:hypothetical protein
MEEKAPPPTYSPNTAGEAALQSTVIKPQARKPHDSSVSFEEYYYYAQKTRAEELTIEAPTLNWRTLLYMEKKTGHEAPAISTEGADFSSADHRLQISDEEWTNASRTFRTAGWGACKYCVAAMRMILHAQALMVNSRLLSDYH